MRSVDNAGVHELFPEPIVGWIRVGVDRPIDIAGSGLTYAVGPDLGQLSPGDAITVPLGRGNTPTAGWVVCSCPPPDPPLDTVKHVLARRDAVAIPPDLVRLGEWIARYYLAPIGPTLSSLVPSAVKRGTGTVQRRLLAQAPLPDECPRLGPAQKKVLHTIQSLSETDQPIERRALRDLADVATYGPIDALVRHGLLIETRRSDIEATWRPTHLPVAAAPTPTAAQQKIIDDIGEVLDTGFSVHLMRGVTGSGKTEVYLRLIEQVLKAGRSALVLVPEISLTPQTAGRLSARFPDQQVALMHSALPAAARNAQWSAAKSGEARIVLGARSGVFAPMPPETIGLIVVDEEHDASFKQDATPRYHGRDVAIRRGQDANCPVLLCSATPSLESWHNANTRNDWTLHHLAERAPGLSIPRTRVVDRSAERREDPGGGAIGPTLRAALDRVLDEGHQALLLLNRRGWATYIACHDRRCGWTLQCEHCDVTMVYHRAGEVPGRGYLRCHHCHREVRLPKTCPDCGGRPMRLGQGTQRLEEELLAIRTDLVLDKTLVRMDSDSMQHIDHFHTVLAAFQQGEIRVLLGTQMIAKGLDVPGVQLVGVIDADTAMHLPDFRAAERTFQLVSQVTGRCGRGEAPGRAIVQTMDPDAPSIVQAASGATEAFLNAEVTMRRDALLPPITRMARVVVQHVDLTTSEQLSERVAAGLRALAPESGVTLGPMPCPLPRLRQRHRREVLLTATTGHGLQTWLHQALAERVLHGPAIMVDVDPISLL